MRRILNISLPDVITNKLWKITDPAQIYQEISKCKWTWICNKLRKQNFIIKRGIIIESVGQGEEGWTKKKQEKMNTRRTWRNYLNGRWVKQLSTNSPMAMPFNVMCLKYVLRKPSLPPPPLLLHIHSLWNSKVEFRIHKSPIISILSRIN